jgi:hypothetical protein
MEDKLNALLSDPGSMAQVMQLAQQLSSAFGAPQPEESKAEPKIPPSPASLFDGLDPAMITKFLPLLQEFGKSNSQTTQLLYALRPFLKEEKQGKIERAAKLARIIHIGKKAITEMGGLDLV